MFIRNASLVIYCIVLLLFAACNERNYSPDQALSGRLSGEWRVLTHEMGLLPKESGDVDLERIVISLDLGEERRGARDVLWGSGSVILGGRSFAAELLTCGPPEMIGPWLKFEESYCKGQEHDCWGDRLWVSLSLDPTGSPEGDILFVAFRRVGTGGLRVVQYSRV